MPVVVSWDNEQEVIRQDLTDPWTWDEFIGVRPELHRRLDEAAEPQIILLDVQTLNIPRDALRKFQKMANTDLFDHPNLAGFVVISSMRLVRTMGTIFQRTFRREGSKLWFVGSEEELPEMIAEIKAEM